MDSLTPEWLKSLVLHDPDANSGGENKACYKIVEEDPDSCLNLLLVGCETFLAPLKCDMPC